PHEADQGEADRRATGEDESEPDESGCPGQPDTDVRGQRGPSCCAGTLLQYENGVDAASRVRGAQLAGAVEDLTHAHPNLLVVRRSGQALDLCHEPVGAG